MMNTDDDDDQITLPQDTLMILNQFLEEKAAREKAEEELANTKGGNEQDNDIKFEENWQLSQFWYSSATKTKLTCAVQKLIINTDCNIGLLSCPSLFSSIKHIHNKTKLFEFDTRFEAFGDDFIFYDFNEADTPNYLSDYNEFFDIIIVDPPFLSEECIEKISEIVKKMSKTNSKIIFCSGDIVEPWINKYLKLDKCNYRPEHERNLGNAFVSYANFNLDELL